MEKQQPIGRQLKIKQGNRTLVLHVIGYANGHNVWEEKFSRYEDNHY